jgi:hypothetical protein
MSPRRFLGFVSVAATLGACRPAPVALHLSPTPVPTPEVVLAPPVQTRPFEDGYELGYKAGQAEVRPHRPMPTEETADVKSLGAAGNDPDRNPKWQHGWASGYLDAYREVLQNRH